MTMSRRRRVSIYRYIYICNIRIYASRRSSLFPLDVRGQLTVFYFIFTGCVRAGCGGRRTEDAGRALYRRIVQYIHTPLTTRFLFLRFPTARRGLKGRKEKIHTKRIGYNTIHRHCSPFDIYCIIVYIIHIYII